MNFKQKLGYTTLTAAILFAGMLTAFLWNADAQVNDYTFETIDVPGVDFLALTASSDFEDYAGYTKSPDGQNEIAFTLIDGVFTTYDFPGSKNTYFYALGNNGVAAGHYEDSDGLFHGVILEDGELRQYDFPGAIQTEIYGYSDSTGALTGNFIDDSGVRRGFSGDEIIEYPGASATYSDFINTQGNIVGSYIDTEGTYHAFVRISDSGFVSVPSPIESNLEYFFVHGLNDIGHAVCRIKAVGDIPRSYVISLRGTHELQFPGSVSTEGWNINQDGSVVGHYDSPDGRRHGFIAKLEQDTQDTTAQSTDISAFNYTFESIDVPGVDSLALTASNDFEDYAGYTKSADGEKEVAFTLIDGVFKTYDFPGSQKTHFYALGNNGRAAGHYQDSNGLYHGVIVEPDGEMRQYDFPDAVQTEIYSIRDATGALTGNYIDASGVRRGFSGDDIVEGPEASATYAHFTDAHGTILGNYIDAEGIFQSFLQFPDGNFITTSPPTDIAAHLEYFFVYGVNDVGSIVAQLKVVGDIPVTVVGSIQGVQGFKFPGSVSTEGWNINQDGSIVGHYHSADGRIHGFIARPVSEAVSNHFGNAYHVTLAKGLNMISVPLMPQEPMNAKSLAGLTGATTVITLNSQLFVGWTPDAPNDGFWIEGGKGYIVNVPESRDFAFVGAPWTNLTEVAASPPAVSAEISQEQNVWAFVVSGRVGEPNPYEGKSVFDGYRVIVRNLRTNSTISASVQGGYFAAATADLSRRSVVEVGDVIELHVVGPDGNVESHSTRFSVTPEHLANAVLSVRLDGIGKPQQDMLLQNYPNPFNPETWIPYQLEKSADVTLRIYDTSGAVVRTLALGFKSEGFYTTRANAAYWDGRNDAGERIGSGVYFCELRTVDSMQIRRMAIAK